MSASGASRMGTRGTERGDRKRLVALASWVLQGPLAATLSALCVLQLALWMPHYLTWPWHCDLDIFANQALVFVIASLLLAQGWPGWSGVFLSALLAAVGFSFRPQTVLFWPALALAIADGARGSGESSAGPLKALGIWATVFALAIAVLF